MWAALLLIFCSFGAGSLLTVAALAFLSVRAEGFVLGMCFHPKGGEKR